MRYILSTFLIVFLFVLALMPGWKGNPPSQPEALNVKETSEPIHIPEKIDFISQVQQTAKSLTHSPSIITIHHNSENKSHAIKREVTVKFREYPTEQEMNTILMTIEGKIKKKWDNACILKSKTKSTEQLIAYFKARKDVEYAEPNFLLLPNREPNDPLYTRYQQNLTLIKAEQAWDISPGKGEIIVAVVDTGVDLKHQDFKGKLVSGYNVLANDNHPLDDNGHGTHVSGIISARTNNTLGIAGVSWNNKIMPVKAIGAEGTGSSFDIAQGIKWAADHGANVINMSVGNYHPSNILHEAIRYAYNKGIVLVAASGNDNTGQPSYPAAYPEVISVAAVDNQGQRASFSNYGPYIEVAAPGVDIPSTYIYNEYAALSGTSMACPHVAGLAGLILSVNPQLSNEEVRKIMQNSSIDLGQNGRDQQYGFGLINIDNALKMAAKDKGVAPIPKKEEMSSTAWTDRFFKIPFQSFTEYLGLR